MLTFLDYSACCVPLGVLTSILRIHFMFCALKIFSLLLISSAFTDATVIIGVPSSPLLKYHTSYVAAAGLDSSTTASLGAPRDELLQQVSNAWTAVCMAALTSRGALNVDSKWRSTLPSNA